MVLRSPLAIWKSARAFKVLHRQYGACGLTGWAENRRVMLELFGLAVRRKWDPRCAVL